MSRLILVIMMLVLSAFSICHAETMTSPYVYKPVTDRYVYAFYYKKNYNFDTLSQAKSAADSLARQDYRNSDGWNLYTCSQSSDPQIVAGVCVKNGTQDYGAVISIYFLKSSKQCEAGKEDTFTGSFPSHAPNKMCIDGCIWNVANEKTFGYDVAGNEYAQKKGTQTADKCMLREIDCKISYDKNNEPYQDCKVLPDPQQPTEITPEVPPTYKDKCDPATEVCYFVEEDPQDPNDPNAVPPSKKDCQKGYDCSGSCPEGYTYNQSTNECLAPPVVGGGGDKEGGDKEGGDKEGGDKEGGDKEGGSTTKCYKNSLQVDCETGELVGDGKGGKGEPGLGELCPKIDVICRMSQWFMEKPELDPKLTTYKVGQATLAEAGLDFDRYEQRITFAGQCPSGKFEFQAFGRTFSKAIPYNHLCDFLAQIAPWLVAMCYIGAAYFIVESI